MSDFNKRFNGRQTKITKEGIHKLIGMSKNPIKKNQFGLITLNDNSTFDSTNKSTIQLNINNKKPIDTSF
mgnify:CR=1 FL=1